MCPPRKVRGHIYLHSCHLRVNAQCYPKWYYAIPNILVNFGQKTRWLTSSFEPFQYFHFFPQLCCCVSSVVFIGLLSCIYDQKIVCMHYVYLFSHIPCMILDHPKVQIYLNTSSYLHDNHNVGNISFLQCSTVKVLCSLDVSMINLGVTIFDGPHYIPYWGMLYETPKYTNNPSSYSL